MLGKHARYRYIRLATVGREKMRPDGIEPSTSRLKAGCSTAELRTRGDVPASVRGS